MQRKLQILGWTLIWFGMLIFGYVGWELFGTDLVNARVQEVAQTELEDTFDVARQDLPPAEEFVPEVPDGFVGHPPTVERFREDEPELSSGFAVIRIPKIAVDAVVFEGVDRETLTSGPGHMPDTPLPGQPGNAVISGHRTTHGRPFYDVDQLQPGDLIEVETAIGVHSYEVRSSEIVNPWDIWVAGAREGAWLTLTTCHPRFSARQRLVIFAELASGPNLNYVLAIEGRFEEIARST